MTDVELPYWARELLREPKESGKSNANIQDPPGYTSSSLSKKQQAAAAKVAARPKLSQEEMDQLKMKKSWEIALAPAKSLPMNAIMMYMSGNSLQIFSIMMVFMLFKNPIVALTQVNTAFARFETDGTRGKMWQVKAAYILMNCVLLAVGVWKINSMGLLPTTRSDWLAWEVERQPRERTIFALHEGEVFSGR